MKCDFCGSTSVIKTSDGFRCRKPDCEGATQVMREGVPCKVCDEKMEYWGLNSWGEPSYKCDNCNTVVKL